MQSVCRTDTIGRTKFSYPFGNAYSYWRLLWPCIATSSKLNSMLDFVLSSIPAANFVCIQHNESNFRNSTFKFNNEFLRSRICTLRSFRESGLEMSHILSPCLRIMKENLLLAKILFSLQNKHLSCCYLLVPPILVQKDVLGTLT